MPISIRCSSCQAAFRVRDEFAGKRGKCPKCGTIFLAPAAATSSAAAPASIPPPPAPPAPRTAAPEKPSPRKATRRRKRSVPIWVYSVVPGVVLVGAAVGLVYRANTQDAARVAALERRLDPELNRKARGIVPRTEGFVPKPVEKLDIRKPGPAASTEDIIAYVEHGIVKIEVYDESNNRDGLGSGFVIDDSGLVVTNYHVVENAVKADVVFNDGVRYGVEGYLALRPESDVAILKLNGTPVNMRSLDLRYEGEPRTAAAVYSIGHPHGNAFQVTNGIVSRVIKTSQLPADAREFLKSGIGDTVDNLWVSHTARIAPGNSGGPLLNSQGEVIGVNSWVNPLIDLGYAVHAGVLDEMQRKLFPSPHPLKDHRRPTPTVAKVESRFGTDVTVEKLKQLGDELAVSNYACDSDQAYKKFQELALSLTYLLNLRDDTDRADERLKQLLPELIEEVESRISALTAVHWKTAQIKAINQRAAAAVEEPLQGQVLFGAVEKLLEGQEGTRRGLLVKLLDLDRVVFLPLNDAQKDFKPAAGTKFLITGISFGAALRYGENPLEPKEAPIVLSQTFIELPSEAGSPLDPKPSA